MESQTIRGEIGSIRLENANAVRSLKNRQRALEMKMNEMTEKLNALMEHEDGVENLHGIRSTTFKAEKIELVNDGVDSNGD